MPAPTVSPDNQRPTFLDFYRRLSSLTREDGCSWVVVSRTDSTNSMARRYLDRLGFEHAEQCCFVAWEQTSGRGRRGRTWSSAPGKGIYMTLVFPAVRPALLPSLPLSTACGVARVVSRLVSTEVRVKWPNDLLASGRKLAGVLVEAASRRGRTPAAIVGIGVNVNHEESELPLPGATSLTLEGAGLVDAAALAHALSREVASRVEGGKSRRPVIEEIRELTAHSPGDRIRCHTDREVVEGRFAGFTADGSLLLDCSGQRRTIRSSEIVEA